MNFYVKTGDSLEEKTDLAVILAVEGAVLPEKLSDLLITGDFSGKTKQTLLLYGRGVVSPARILLVGLGEGEKVTADTFRNTAALAIKEANKRNMDRVSFSIAGEAGVDDHALTQAMVEGAVLGSYRFLDYKTDLEDNDTFEIKEVLLFGKDASKAEKGIAEGLAITAGVILARDLINRPAAEITPARIGDEALALGQRYGIKTSVLGLNELEEQGFGGIIAVGKASSNEPRFIILEYGQPAENIPTVVLIGKGISFDSGGLDIKPAGNMAAMKCDMSGSATVLGTFEAIARLKTPIHLVGLISSAENMPGSNATRPGDIVKSLSGKTIEILNTDAEGRVVLADAIHYAQSFNPDAIIDFATLTGAIMIALGNHATGLFSTNQTLADKIKIAGEKSAERVWELPLWPEYREMVKSDVADLKNSVGRPAGSITGAAFLAAFAGDFPFAHLDIAATAWLETPIKAYHHKGATGVGVRLMVELLKDYK